MLDRIRDMEHRMATAPRRLLLQPDENQMSGLNRKQRRTLAKKNKSRSTDLEKAGNQIGSALEALQKINGLEGSVKMLDGLGVNIEAARRAMDELGENVQELSFLLEVQREVNLRLLSRLYANSELSEEDALAQLKELEQNVREKLIEDLVREQVGEG